MVRSPSGSSRSRLQTSARPPAPDSRITVGLPSPRHSRYRFRPPMSTRPEKSPLAAEGDADGVADWAKPEVVPLEKEQDLIRVGGVAKEPAPLRTVGPACGLVLVKNRRPGRVVLDRVADEQTGHERLRSPWGTPRCAATSLACRQYVVRHRRPIRTSTPSKYPIRFVASTQ